MSEQLVNLAAEKEMHLRTFLKGMKIPRFAEFTCFCNFSEFRNQRLFDN
jgi:hypothetical protein